MTEVLAKATVVIILQYVSVKVKVLYSLNLYDIICQLYLNEKKEPRELSYN